MDALLRLEPSALDSELCRMDVTQRDETREQKLVYDPIQHAFWSNKYKMCPINKPLNFINFK